MDSTASTEDRIGVIQALAARWTDGEFGRTKLVKSLYFLQALRNVPLGYRFRLYSYGPYDSAVLDDLDYASTLGQVRVKTIHYCGGYGYNISTPESPVEQTDKFTTQYEEDLEWVVEQFGSYSPSELELAATIVFADRESSEQTCDELKDTVGQIKPHFDADEIVEHIQCLKGKGLISVH